MNFQKEFDSTLLSHISVSEEIYVHTDISTFHLSCITAALGCSSILEEKE